VSSHPAFGALDGNSQDEEASFNSVMLCSLLICVVSRRCSFRLGWCSPVIAIAGDQNAGWQYLIARGSIVLGFFLNVIATDSLVKMRAVEK
jgi:hypothetical protein